MSLHWALQQLIAPALEPVSMVEAKQHVRQDLTVDDGILSGLLTAARTQVERDTQRQLVTATWQATFDRFPWWDLAGWRERQPSLPGWQWAEHRAIRLPKPPLQAGSVTIAYTDTFGNPQTMNPLTAFQVDSASEPGRVQPVYGSYWPITRSELNAVRIGYMAGWTHTLAPTTVAAGVQTVTPASMADIKVGQSYEVDVGVALEVIVITAVTLTTFTATFAAAHTGPFVISAVPRPLKQAILLLVGHWFANRETVVPGSMTCLPLAYDALVGSWWTGEYR